MMKKILSVVALIAVAFLLVWLGRVSAPAAPHDVEEVHEHTGEDQAEIWTCPMHPQIQLPEPGRCPICGMDLVLRAPGGDDSPRRLVLSEGTKTLARVATAAVERRFVTRPVRMIGKLDYDETQARTISAWVPGRLERLYVDYTGVQVQAGDHLFELYSPELLTAQQELLASHQRHGATEESQSDFLRESDRRAYEAIRQKLVLWGLSEEQVDEIETRGTSSDRMTIHSPTSGTVIEKHLDQGAYVQTGTPVYSIADLEHLWVWLEAYEQDLPWLAYAQQVQIQVEALPGEVFTGTVSFIDPVLHERTRTARLRVNLANPQGRLKPGMFVRATALARLGENGRLLEPDLEGKWISPMHPEVVADGPGQCRVCGMDLVPASELGLAGGGDARPPLIVPSSAVLVTGKRAVVYVEVPDADAPTYEGREVNLGPRAGEHYVVLDGLSEGERVVVNGAFRLDSAMQIQARPSMMSMPAEAAAEEANAGRTAFRASLEPALEAYLAVQEALARDDLEAALTAAEGLSDALAEVSVDPLEEQERSAWEAHGAELSDAAQAARQAPDIGSLRRAFEDLSKALLSLAEAYGLPGEGIVYRQVHCPMAFPGQGASWLQQSTEVANPYLGPDMVTCGQVESTFEGH